MQILNKNSKIQLGSEVINNPILLLSRDNDSYVNKTRDISFNLLKDDVNGDPITHEFLVRFNPATEFYLKQFKGDYRDDPTDTSNITSTYTDGETDEDGNLIEKNLVTYLMTGGDINAVEVTNYGYADYIDVQQYFQKDANGQISFNDNLPAPLIEVAQEVILNNLYLGDKTAKELGFQF